MRDAASDLGLIAFCCAAIWLLVAAVSWLTWYVSRRRAARRAEREADRAKLLQLLDRLDVVYASINALERHIAMLSRFSALLDSHRRTLEALAPSTKEPSSG